MTASFCTAHRARWALGLSSRRKVGPRPTLWAFHRGQGPGCSCVHGPPSWRAFQLPVSSPAGGRLVAPLLVGRSGTSSLLPTGNRERRHAVSASAYPGTPSSPRPTARGVPFGSPSCFCIGSRAGMRCKEDGWRPATIHPSSWHLSRPARLASWCMSFFSRLERYL